MRPSARCTGRQRSRSHLGPVVLFLVVLLLVVAPLVAITTASLTSGPIGSPGRFTLDSFRRLMERPGLATTLRTTVQFATAASALSVALGAVLAWVTERTDVPGRSTMRMLAVLPLIVPGFATTAAWAVILNERVGIGNTLLRALGADGNILTSANLLAMIWVDGSDGFVLPYLMLVAALRAHDVTLDEASAAAGAGRWRTTALITVPLLVPAVLAAFVISFVRTIDGLQVPAMLGIPAGIRVLSTEIYLATRRFPVDLNLAATLAMLQVGMMFVTMALYWRVAGREGAFRTLTGRGQPPQVIALRRLRLPIALLGWSLLVAVTLVPLAAMVVVSLMPYYTTVTASTLGTLGFSAYASVLSDPRIARSIGVTLHVAGWTAVLTTLLGSAIAWSAVRRRSALAQLTDALAMLPLAVPGLVLGLALLWLFVRLPLPIYGTPRLLVLALVTAFLPYAVRTSHAVLVQLHPELEEAARTAGAGTLRTFITIVAPLVAPGFVVSVLFVLSRSVHALSVPVLLSGPGREVIAVVVLDLFDQGSYPQLHALSLMMTGTVAFATGTMLLVRRLLQRTLGTVPTRARRKQETG
jgi:iron(III) transport system permease protein